MKKKPGKTSQRDPPLDEVRLIQLPSEAIIEKNVKFILPEDLEDHADQLSLASPSSFQQPKSSARNFAQESPISFRNDDVDPFSSQQYFSTFTAQQDYDPRPIDMSYYSQFKPKTKDDVSFASSTKKKKVGCNCKKRQCQSKYCWCIKNNKVCSDLCKCHDCVNKTLSEVHKTSSATPEATQKTCRCKKKGCKSGYCDCFNNGFNCSSYCQCMNCLNKPLPTVVELILSKKVPRIKKRIRKFSSQYRSKATRSFRPVIPPEILEPNALPSPNPLLHD